MPHKPSQPNLPPPLALLRDTPSATLYGLAAKSALIEGLAGCRGEPVTGAAWRDGKNELELTLQARKVSFKVIQNRLITGCSCRAAKPGAYCSHAITAWAILKRIVSPQSLFSLRFNEPHLAAVSRLIGLETGPPEAVPQPPVVLNPLFERLQQARARRKGALSAMFAAPPQPEAEDFRLVLEIKHGRLSGGLRHGREQVHGWALLPPDLRSFLARHYFFEPTGRYFSEFTALEGKYPVVLLQGREKEIILDWRDDAPIDPGITFSFDEDTVKIYRCLADGSFLPGNCWRVGECIIAPDERAIRPVKDAEPWKLWETVREELEVMADLTGESFEDSGATLSTRVRLFNYAAVSITTDLVQKLGKRCRFVANGVVAEPVAIKPSHILNIEDAFGDEVIRLTPQGEAFGLPLPFSAETFRLFLPAFRASLPQPLRAKKRLSAIVEAGFAMLEAVEPKTRNAALRNAMRSPDFIKRKIKANAKLQINSFVGNCEKKMLLLLATDGGWRFVTDDRLAQTRLMKLLYDLFGLDSLIDGEFPCSLEVPRDTLLPRLGELAISLRRQGFDLRVDGEALASGSWEFTIDASRHEIDWFELKPEIRLNGRLLDGEEIRAALAEGVVRQEDGCFLLGDEERRILELMVGSQGAGKRKKKTEIVRIPRLQILDWLELRRSGVTLRLPPEDERLLANLTRLEKLPERPLPNGLTAILRHYQKEGYNWLAFLLEHRFGACLADDMGLGKTVQTIAFLAGIAEGILPVLPAGAPHLVVVPPSLLFNWESEIARFYPGFRVLTYAGSKRTPDFAEADIILTSYGIILRDIEMLENLSFDVIVFDEAQVVKNLQAATTGAARRLKGRFKLVLTGTPMENHLGEYYAIMDLCVPGLLGSYDQFRRRIDLRGLDGVDMLIRRTRPFILRRSKQMIADELPSRVETDLYLDMTSKQRILYQKMVEEVKGAVEEAFRNKAPGQARMIALTALLRLRQICLSPSLLTGVKGESPKLECLADQLIELREEGHSALVFSQFTGYLDIVEEHMKHRKLPYLRLDGATPVTQRKSLVNRFQNSDEPLVFLISLKAGGKGLNLTRATYVYHLDPWWNPAVENQASDRAHRIGQTQRVTVTRLLMRHTVEEKMMTLKERKLKLYKALLDDAAGAGGASLSKEDFDFLLGR